MGEDPFDVALSLMPFGLSHFGERGSRFLWRNKTGERGSRFLEEDVSGSC